MYIESVQLKNFRNYETLELNLDRETNIFYGDNAQRKTNILESVYLCGTTKSHKGSKDREMIRFGQEDAHIRMMVKKDGLVKVNGEVDTRRGRKLYEGDVIYFDGNEIKVTR